MGGCGGSGRPKAVKGGQGGRRPAGGRRPTRGAVAVVVPMRLENLPDVRSTVTSLVAWVKRVPQRVVQALEETTGLPPGFWVVLALAVSVGVVVTAATVTVVYHYVNQPPAPVPVTVHSSA